MPTRIDIPTATSAGMSNHEEMQRLKAEIWASDYVPPALRRRRDRGKRQLAALPKIVAEGDSWFAYPVGLDVLDQLRANWGYSIERVASAGDTLENMVYGTKLRRDFTRKPAGLVEVLDKIRQQRPEVVLFSGGGNDVAGDELLRYLNHASAPSSAGGTRWLREDVWNEALAQMEASLRVFAQAVWAVAPKLPILMHGYANPVPDGRAVLNFPFGFKFFGPWMRLAFAGKGYTDWRKTEPWVGRLLGDYNRMLAGVAADSGGRFIYVDVRKAVGRDDWANELHPTNAGFKAVATVIHRALEKLP